MAREKSFTDEQVIDAAKQLLAQNREVTGSGLRMVIGRGRPSVLIAAYNNLLEQGELTIEEEPVEESIPQYALPPEVDATKANILTSIEELIQKINDQAHHSVQQKFTDAITESEQKCEEALKREADAILAQEKAFEEVEDTLEAKSEIEAEYEQLETDIHKLTHELALSEFENERLRTEVESASQTIKDKSKNISNLNKQVTKLTDSLHDVQLELAAKKADINNLKANENKLEQQITTLNTEVSERTEQNQKLHDESLVWKTKFEDLENTHGLSMQNANDKIQALESETEKLKAKLIKAIAKLEHAQQDVSTLEHSNDELQKKLDQIEMFSPDKD